MILPILKEQKGKLKDILLFDIAWSIFFLEMNIGV